MSALLAALISGTTIGGLVHLWHMVRFQTVGNDLAGYRAARQAPAVTPPAEQDGGIVPARDVWRTADRYRRKLGQVERENATLRSFAYDLLNGQRRLWCTPRIPAPSVHRLGWRDRARWFTPWPQAAITGRVRA